MKRSKLCSLILLLSLFALNGCSGATQLEDRQFALIMGMDKVGNGMKLSYGFPDLNKVTAQAKAGSEQKGSGNFGEGSDFLEAERQFQNHSDKKLEYSHLKAVILSKEFVKDKKTLVECLQYIEGKELIPRNTLLFLTEGTSGELIMDSVNTEGSMGEYLDHMIKNDSVLKDSAAVTVGDFLNHWHNEEKLTLLPVLASEEGKPIIKDYQIVQKLDLKSNLSGEEAVTTFFARAEGKGQKIRLQEEDTVLIKQVQRELAFRELDSKPFAVLKYTGRIKLENRNVKDENTLKYIESEFNKEMESRVMEIFHQKQREENFDLYDTYGFLASHNREMYMKYKNDRMEYDNNLEIAVKCDFKIIGS